MEIYLTTTECHLPYGITQCYLPPNTSEHTPALPQPDRLVLIYRPFKDGGLSKPRPRVQRATGPLLLCDSPGQQDPNPQSIDRQSSTLTTKLSRHPSPALVQLVCQPNSPLFHQIQSDALLSVTVLLLFGRVLVVDVIVLRDQTARWTRSQLIRPLGGRVLGFQSSAQQSLVTSYLLTYLLTDARLI